MPIKILTAGITGVDAVIIEVEADAGGGDFGQISIVGLPDTATSEAKERVKSAIRNTALKYPKRKITINLAPANIRKHGPSYDLPIAVSILALNNRFKVDFKNILIVGELSLNGEVRRVSGILAIGLKAKQLGIMDIYIPADNAVEANLIPDMRIFPVKSLMQLIHHFTGQCPLPHIIQAAPSLDTFKRPSTIINLNSIKGHSQAKRVLEISAAGGHSILLIGPPGSGKTLLAQALSGLFPDLSINEVLEVTNIHSIADELKAGAPLITAPPFRSPHHSASGTSLIGGGTWPRPGEISLAHHGVLFLDEFPEFSRTAIENMRQPLESKSISINRTAGTICFPCNFTLVAAMNPCPCGYQGDKTTVCHCSEQKILNYRQKISGPILDRIDIHLRVHRVNFNELTARGHLESSEDVRKRVIAARQIQAQRYNNCNYRINSEMTNSDITRFCALNPACFELLKSACSQLNLSSRAYFRVLKIARTIADLAGEQGIQKTHLAEALQYRASIE